MNPSKNLITYLVLVVVLLLFWALPALATTYSYTTIAYPGRVDTPMIEDLKVPWISAKISPNAVAKALLKGIQHRRKEIFLPPQVLLLHVLTLFPSLSDWATRAFHLEGWQEPKTASKSQAMEKHPEGME